MEKGVQKAAEELEKCNDFVGADGLLFAIFIYGVWFNIFNADDPHKDPNATGDPYKTLFVARLVSDYVYYSFEYSIWDL